MWIKLSTHPDQYGYRLWTENKPIQNAKQIYITQLLNGWSLSETKFVQIIIKDTEYLEEKLIFYQNKIPQLQLAKDIAVKRLTS